jgi:hypothetical protein
MNEHWYVGVWWGVGVQGCVGQVPRRELGETCGHPVVDDGADTDTDTDTD